MAYHLSHNNIYNVQYKTVSIFQQRTVRIVPSNYATKLTPQTYLKCDLKTCSAVYYQNVLYKTCFATCNIELKIPDQQRVPKRASKIASKRATNRISKAL